MSREKPRIDRLSQKEQEAMHLHPHKGKTTGKGELNEELWKAVYLPTLRRRHGR
ncbi:MAG: hypothetical protein Q8P64_18570 [Deltaproteobacteria bacterium]|nr:hypothetical protein [Deltaproteobacteria bacterium]